MIATGWTGVERSGSPRRSTRSFMMLIMKNCEVKYSGKMKTKTRMIESNGSGGEICDGTLKSPSCCCTPFAERRFEYLATWSFWSEPLATCWRS